MAFERDPHIRLRTAVSEWLKSEGLLDYSGLDSYFVEVLPLPRRWERFDDVALLPAASFAEDAWIEPPLAALLSKAGEAAGLWSRVSSALGVERLARKGEISGQDRRPAVELLFGDDDSVVRVENGIRYPYRLTRSMFSMGNMEERRRMGAIDATGEEILDLYCGIGYYTLPILVHGGAARVIACDWCEDALSALADGLRLNRVDERCTILAGDNRRHGSTIIEVADRVLLGLLPNAWDGVPIALAALRTDGGIMHLHGTAPTDDHEGWLYAALERCNGEEERLAEVAGNKAREIVAIEQPSQDLPVIRVKSHSPHWDHVVVDLHVG